MPAGGTRIPRAPRVEAPASPTPEGIRRQAAIVAEATRQGATFSGSPDLSALLSEAGRIGAQPVPEAPPVVAPPAIVAPLPEQSEAAALRAQLAAMADQLRAAEARAAEAIRARADTSRGPTVEVGSSGAIVLKGFKQSRPWYAWPSQIDALAEGVDVASLPASHVLRRMVEAAAGLPRRKEGGAK